MFSPFFDKTSQFWKIYICGSCFAQVYAQIVRFIVKLMLSVRFFTKKLNFKQTHSCARSLAQVLLKQSHFLSN